MRHHPVLAGLVLLVAAAAQAADLNVTVGSTSSSTILPLLAVNAGPVPSGEAGNADLTAQYLAYGVTGVRTHDFYGPLDMSKMYPDRSRDPSQSSSYDFTASDSTFAAITNAGLEVYFRLGDSYNNAKPPATAAERANWARAAVEVIRHYREGQWNGYRAPIRYVEIWNEPDNPQFWPSPRTRSEFMDLFVLTAKALRAAFPDLKIGGPGFTPAVALGPTTNRVWLTDLLAAITANGLSIDFLSWHIYSNSASDFETVAKMYADALKTAGLGSIVQHVTEWNTESEGDPALRTGARGASIMTAAWIVMQEQGIAYSTFYRGNDTSPNMPTFYGMFYADGRPKKIALSFSLWALLARHDQRLSLTRTDGRTDVRMIAGRSSGARALLVANPTTTSLTLALTDAAASSARRTVRQVTDSSTEIVTTQLTAGQTITLGPYTTTLVTWPESRRRAVGH